METTLNGNQQDTMELMMKQDTYNSTNNILLQIREKDMLIEKLQRENEELQNKIRDLTKSNTKKVPQSRYWRKDEHERFLQALEKFGKKDVRSISAFVGTRSPTQVRTHAQKWFLKQKRETERRSDKKKGSKRKSSSSDDEDDILNGDDSNDGYTDYSTSSQRVNNRSMTTRSSTSVSSQEHQYDEGHKIDQKGDSQQDLQLLLDGIRKFDYEYDLGKKISLIQKEFLPEKTVGDVTRMIATYPIAVDPQATNPQKKYFFPTNVHTQIPNFHYQMDPMRHNQFVTMKPEYGYPRIDSQSNGFHGNVHFEPKSGNESVIRKENVSAPVNHPSSQDAHGHDKDDEDLENELQNLQKNSKKPLSGGLSGYLGHPIGLSPTVFPGTPLEFASPLMSQTPLLVEGILSPFSYGLSKTASSPLFFVGPDHKKV